VVIFSNDMVMVVAALTSCFKLIRMQDEVRHRMLYLTDGGVNFELSLPIIGPNDVATTLA
jgi:predicted membrane-bound mannosyltransferase